MPHDLQLWCEDCQVGYEGDCVHHGPLTRIKDTDVDTRARRSIPSVLQLRDQQDFTGVYARQHLSKRLQFGPLQAIKVLDGTDKAREAAHQITQKGGLVLWVTEASGEKYLLDTRQEEKTNWMCFVRAAQHKPQQNIIAFQYRGQIFFVTIKEIPAECELRVWYSKDYAERMGTTLLSEERFSSHFRARERFHCIGCTATFSSSSSLDNHCCTGNGRGKETSAVSASSTSAGPSSSIEEVASSSSRLPPHTSRSPSRGLVGTVRKPFRRGKGIRTFGATVSRVVGRGPLHKASTRRLRASGLTSYCLEASSTPQERGAVSGLSVCSVDQPSVSAELSSTTPSAAGGFKRKHTSVEKESESETVQSVITETVSESSKDSEEEESERGKGTSKRHKVSQTYARSKFRAVPFGGSSHAAGVSFSEGESVQDVPRPVEEASRQLTRETIASEIRAQVLQSVHSISSCKDSESLVLQQSESYVSEVAEPIHRVVSIDDIGVVGSGGSGGITGTEDVQGVVEEGVELHVQSIFVEETIARLVPPREELGLPEERFEWPVLPAEESALLEQSSAELFLPTEEERSSQLVLPVEEERGSQLVLPTEEETGQLILPVEEERSFRVVLLSEEGNQLVLPSEEEGNQRLLQTEEDSNQLGLPTEEESSLFSQVEEEERGSQLVSPAEEEERGELVSPAEEEARGGQLVSPAEQEERDGQLLLTVEEESSSRVTSPAEEHSLQGEGGGGEEGQQLCGVCGEVEPHTCSGRIFSCPHCSKSFTSRFKLSRHQLIHGGERQYRCNICGRSFHRKDHLKNHLQIHKPTKQFKCDRADCGKEYNSYMSYRKHCAFHSAEEGDLQCKFCYKMFDNKNELIYHLKVHVGTRSVKNPSEKKFQCDQCDRRFFTRKDVKRHLVVHTGTRDFCCSLCPQKFGRKDHLVRHIKKSHGVTDLTRLETLADPLAIPGSSSGAQAASAPLSPGLSSVSTSSGETTGLPSYLFSSSPSHQASLPPSSPSASMDPGMSSLPSYSDVNPPSFSGFMNDPSDLRLLVSEPIKEEPDLTASMTGLGPDLSNILGLYLPSSEGINMTGIMETSHTHSIVTTHPLHLQDSPSLPPPPAYAGPHYQSLSSLHPPPSPSLLPVEGEEERGGMMSPASTSDPNTPTTTTAVTTSSQFLPGFDQAFP